MPMVTQHWGQAASSQKCILFPIPQHCPYEAKNKRQSTGKVLVLPSLSLFRNRKHFEVDILTPTSQRGKWRLDPRSCITGWKASPQSCDALLTTSNIADCPKRAPNHLGIRPACVCARHQNSDKDWALAYLERQEKFSL